MDHIADGFIVAEAPVFDRRDGSVLVSDAVGGGLWRVASGRRPVNLVPHRHGIGGAALHTDGGVVVSGRNVAHKHNGATTTLLSQDTHEGYTHFNDLTTDGGGRVYVALVDMQLHPTDRRTRSGIIFRIDEDGSARVVAEGIAGPNGMAFSPDGRSFFVSDTFAHVVWRYEVEPSGNLKERQRWSALPDGGPDGMAMTAAGSLWVALHHDSAVVLLDTEGREVARVATPTPATSVCFGGDDLRTLFVTTGDARSPIRIGSVLRLHVDVPGLAVTPARVNVVSRG